MAQIRGTIMKNKWIASIIAIGLLLIATPVQALGTAKVEFSSKSEILIDEIFTVDLSVTEVKDTEDGIVSMGGIISFDPTRIEYISAEEIEAPYRFQINEQNYKIAGVDFTMQNGIQGPTTIYRFTFRAKTEGITSITLEDARLTDRDDYLDVSVKEVKIHIIKKTEDDSVIESPVEKEPIDKPSEEVVKGDQESTLKNEIITENKKEQKNNKTEYPQNKTGNEKEEAKENHQVSNENEKDKEESLEQKKEKITTKEVVEKTSSKKKTTTLLGRIQKVITDIFEMIRSIFE